MKYRYSKRHGKPMPVKTVRITAPSYTLHDFRNLKHLKAIHKEAPHCPGRQIGCPLGGW